MDTFLSIISAIPAILGGALMLIGALKIFARYTKSEADDKLLAAIEKPIRLAKELAERLKATPKDEEKKD